MASAPVLETVTSTSIMAIVEHNPVVVLTDTDKAEQLFAEIKAECDAFVPDMTTKKGRDALRAQASKVVTTKTTIDKAGLALTKQWRDQTKAVNDARAEIIERLEAMAKDVRRPLTEWEEADKERIAECDLILTNLRAAATVTLDDTAATVRERGARVWKTELDAERFAERLVEAQTVKDQTVEVLKSALARLTQEEADKAELERLRKEAADREEADRIAAEKEEQERAEAERIERERIAAEEEAQRAEERRVAAEKAEAERIERAKHDAAEAAAREAQEQARKDQEARDRAHEEQLAAERAKVAEAERAEQQRQADLRRQQEEQEQRDADLAHRTKVKTAAKEAIMATGIAERAAVKLVMAILANEIPNVSLRF